MPTQNTLEFRPPHRFGMREVVVLNLLAIVPSAIGSGLLVVGLTGTPLAVMLAISSDVPIWVALIALCCLALALVMYSFLPGLMFANYYLSHLVSHLQSDHGGVGCICQVATQPRTCRGARAFWEDADDVGVLTIQSGVLTFRGDHSDLTVDLSTNVSAELCNIGCRGLWFASRRIRLLLPERERVREIDIVERQCWSVVRSRGLMRQIFEAIKSNIEKAQP